METWFDALVCDGKTITKIKKKNTVWFFQKVFQVDEAGSKLDVNEESYVLLFSWSESTISTKYFELLCIESIRAEWSRLEPGHRAFHIQRKRYTDSGR